MAQKLNSACSWIASKEDDIIAWIWAIMLVGGTFWFGAE